MKNRKIKMFVFIMIGIFVSILDNTFNFGLDIDSGFHVIILWGIIAILQEIDELKK